MALKRRLAALVLVTAAASALVKVCRRRQQRDRVRPAARHSRRDQQPHIVEEWGAESFPASDPPQSW